MSALGLQPSPETLIPAINTIRKIKACDALQLSKVLERLPSIFENHGSLSSLTTIIAMGLCQHLQHQPLPSVLLVDILGAFPGDNELDIKDSIYESKLMDDDNLDVEEQNEWDSATNQKKQKIPMSLLRIPKDLQIHLFHFLMLDDLHSVQRACRSLCIVARNPLSLCSLKMKVDWKGRSHFLSNCYSKIKSLNVRLGESLKHYFTEQPASKMAPVKFIENWSRSVTDLSLSIPVRNAQADTDPNQSFCFQNVERCELHKWISSLRLIQSYETLKHLSLDFIELNDNAVDQICKFQNLEQLHLQWIGGPGNNSTPITLCNLKHLRFGQFCDHDLIHRIINGLQPSSITIVIDSNEWVDGSPIAGDICGINDINFIVKSLPGFASVLRQQFLPNFAKAEHSEHKLFQKCSVVIHIDTAVQMICHEDVMSPIVDLFQYAQESKLDISFISRYPKDTCHWRLLRSNFLERILDAPFDTFTANTLNIDCKPSISVHDREFRNLCYRRDSEVNPKGFKKYVLRMFQEKEESLEPWLVLNEDTMKRIGLRSFDIKYECGLSFWDEDQNEDDESENEFIHSKAMEFIDQARVAWEQLAPQILQICMKNWTSRSERCLVSYDECSKSYTFNFSTEVKS